MTTLGLLAGIAELLYQVNSSNDIYSVKYSVVQHMKEDRYTALALLVAYFLLLPGLLYIAYRNEHTSSVLCTGWSPVLLAMLISSGGGMILDQAVKKFRGIAVFSPVMNGAGGNLVAIQVRAIHLQCCGELCRARLHKQLLPTKTLQCFSKVS